MLIIKEQDFYTKLNSGHILETDKVLLKEQVIINEHIITWEHRIIKNVVFEQKVIVEQVDLICGLSFEFCEFKKGIAFSNVIVSKYDSNKFPLNSSLYFHNCTIKSLKILNSRIERGFNLFAKTKVDRLIIERSVIGNGGINIKESEISKRFDLRQVQTESFTVSNSLIESAIRLESVKTTSVSFIKSTFNNSLKLWNIYNETDITFNYNFFGDEVEIAASKIKGIFSHGDTFKRKLIIKLNNEENIISSLKELYITEIDLGESFVFKGHDKSIEKLTIPFTSKIKGVLKFSDCEISETNLSGVNEYSKLIFKKITFENLNVIDFTNFSDITFVNSKGNNQSCFEITNSDLGITKFNDFSFKSFPKLKIGNSVFNKIICSNIEWFEEEQLVSDFDQSQKSKSYKNKREIYRQFKQVLKSNGNAIDSLAFQAKEIQYYRKELLKSGNYSLGDRIIMLVNMTNNYGLSWTKATGIILVITLFFYLLLSVLISPNFLFKFSCDYEDIVSTLKYFWENNNLFVQLLNPTRRFSVVYGTENINNLVYWLDILHRIVLSIFIFQIIKAFRKFVLK
jgi:hypothetical protein